MDGPVPDPGIERPGTGRPERDARAEGSVGDQVNRNGVKRREDAIDRQQNPRRGVGIDTEDLENSGNQVGIERRFPGGGASMPFCLLYTSDAADE